MERTGSKDGYGHGLAATRNAGKISTSSTITIVSNSVLFKDHRSSQALIDPLAIQGNSPTLFSALGRIRLEAGDLTSAASYFDQASLLASCDDETRCMNSALLASAYGDWPKATTILESLLQKDPDNLAVCVPMRLAPVFHLSSPSSGD